MLLINLYSSDLYSFRSLFMLFRIASTSYSYFLRIMHINENEEERGRKEEIGKEK